MNNAGWSPPSATCTVFVDMSLPTTYILCSSIAEASRAAKQGSALTSNICISNQLLAGAHAHCIPQFSVVLASYSR